MLKTHDQDGFAGYLRRELTQVRCSCEAKTVDKKGSMVCLHVLFGNIAIYIFIAEVVLLSVVEISHTSEGVNPVGDKETICIVSKG